MTASFMPHGTCFLWQPGILTLHIISDAFIALAYFVIAGALWWLVSKVGDLPFKSIVWMFALFIVSCGAAHVLTIWVIWHPDYWLEGGVKAITAISSVATALLLLPLLPKALALRSPYELELINAELAKALNSLREVVHHDELEQRSARTVHDTSLSQVAERLEDLMSELRSRSRAGIIGTESLFNLVVEASPNAMVLVDERGRIVLVNAQTEKLFGYTRNELLGQSIELLVPGRLRRGHPKFRDSFNSDPLARKMGAGRDLHGRHKDGSEVPVEIGLNPIKTQVETFTLAAVTDISERKAIEEMRLLQASTMQHAAEIEAQRERELSTMFQRAVLPLALSNVAGCTFDAVYEPGLSDAQVGGDWYDAIHLADGRILISIGDVPGSGREASIIVGVARQIIRGISQLHADPMLILDAADRALSLEYPSVYVSAWVGLIDLVAHTITYASAGHPPPFLVSTSGNVRELEDDTTMLVGLREGPRREATTVAIEQGDALVLYTDGVTEAGRDLICGHLSLRAAARRFAISLDPHPALAIKRCVIPNGSLDDVAVLVARTDCDEAERHIERWHFNSLNRSAACTVRNQFVESLRTRRGFSVIDYANAEVVFGELVGNVVRHASSGDVEVIADHGGPHSVLHVLDRGAGFRHTSRLPADPYAEHGRGLFLIAALTVDFTVAQRHDGGSHARVALRGGSHADDSRPDASAHSYGSFRTADQSNPAAGETSEVKRRSSVSANRFSAHDRNRVSPAPPGVVDDA
jgi:PAS domain S-box-containing protein